MQTANDQILCIGQGTDFFEVRVSIEKFHGKLQVTHNNPCWISYRFLGQVIQSEIFCTLADAFIPMTKSFRIRSSISELMEHFRDAKNKSLRVHVCTNGRVLGTAAVDLLPLMNENEIGRDFEGRMINGECEVQPADGNKDDSAPNGSTARLAVSIYLDRELLTDHQSLSKVRLSISSQTDVPDKPSEASLECTSRSAITDAHNHDGRDDEISRKNKQIDEKEHELKSRESELNKKEKHVYESAVALEKKRLEWEQWRHQEECKWHEKLRNKEAAAMRAIEDRASGIEKERLRSLESSRSEYEKLENRLRNALAEVESKERQVNEIELNHQSEYKRKMAELDLREKLMKEELKHTIDLEKAKTSAVVERAVAVEKSLAAALKEIDELRVKHRNTPEVALMQQLAEVKGQLADSERRNEAIKAEKAEIVLEKEQFRASVNKLARALRHEREKANTRKENCRQQKVRLSYDEYDNAFVLGGSQDEVQKILSDLSNLSKLQSPSMSTFATPLKQSNATSHIPESVATMTHTNAPPMPSPQPTRPSCTSTGPSINS